jgi:hypothetical protein
VVPVRETRDVNDIADDGRGHDRTYPEDLRQGRL